MTSSTSQPQPSNHPGYKAVLIPEALFGQLKSIQMESTDPRYDLRDVVSAALQLVLLVPESREMILARAREELRNRL
jgi:hypothetical protein